MKRSKNNVLPLVLWSSLLFGLSMGCELIVDIDVPEHEPAITLNCFFNTDTTFSVYLAEDRFILDNSPDFKPIPDATVTLYADGISMGQFLPSDSIEGIYQLAIQPGRGVSYRITAEHPGYATVESTDQIPMSLVDAEIRSLEKRASNYDDLIELTYAISDTPGMDFYETVLYREERLYDYYEDEDTSYIYPIGVYLQEISYSKAGASLNEFEDYERPNLFSDELFDGRETEIRIEFYHYQYYNPTDQPDSVRYFLNVRHVSENYYRYTTTKELQSSVDDNPFAQAAQVYTNITNGYGVFAGYNSMEISFKLP